MKELNDKHFIESNNIKVFPCAYRGYYNTETTPAESLVFDPEARSTTEANFTNTFHKLSSTKSSYVVSWDNSTQVLKCVIGGYYFEIYNHTIDDFFYEDSEGDLQPYCLCIQTTPLALATDSSADANRESTILASFVEDETFLDIYRSGSYIFTGLALVQADSSIEVADSLIPFTLDYTYTEIDTVSDTNRADVINNYILQEEQYIKVLTSTTLTNGTPFYSRELDSKRVNPIVFPITALLDTGEGKYSLRMIEDGNNTTIARGDYSIALGRSTSAEGKYAVALGDDTKASGEGALAAGSNTSAEKKGSVALGTNTITNAENQVVIGQYNSLDSNQAFIIANGSSTAGSNKFTVGYNGDVKALGDLEISGGTTIDGEATINNNLNISGNITANKVGDGETYTNTLTLGANIAKSAGALDIYGTGTTKVFEVSNTGKTYIADTTDATASDGALKIDGGVRIAKKLNVGETLAVAGSIVLGGNETANIVNVKTAPDASKNEVNVKITGSALISSNTKIQGDVVLTGDTDSNSKTTGALTVTGGVGIGKNLHVGGTATIENSLTATTGTASFGTTNISGALSITDSTDYTAAEGETPLRAALKVAGGVHVDKNTNIVKALTVGEGVTVGGNLNVATDITSGSITSSGNITLTGTGSTHTLTLGHKNSSDDKSAGSILVYTNAGNEGFKVEETGKASIYNSLVIGATEPIENKTLVVGGPVEIQGAVTATSLQLTTNTDSSLDGKLVAKTIEATQAIKTQELLVGTNGAVAKLTPEHCLIAAPQIKLTVTEEDKFATIDGKFMTTDYTTLANKVTVSTNGAIEGVSTLTATGQIQANTFNAVSDVRKKTNIVDYICKKSILDLPVKSFEYLNDETHSKYIGCIAQDLQEICPEIVDTDAKGFLSIQETKLVYLLLQEVKTLKERIEALEEV